MKFREEGLYGINGPFRVADVGIYLNPVAGGEYHRPFHLR